MILQFTANQLVSHLIGDYVIQSDWMAKRKTEDIEAAILHGWTYSAPFIFLCDADFGALIFIVVTHVLIDHFRLARYLCYFKNQFAPKEYRSKWIDCQGTGYHKDTPPWMSVWLMIICDNTLHLICNAISLQVFQ